MYTHWQRSTIGLPSCFPLISVRYSTPTRFGLAAQTNDRTLSIGALIQSVVRNGLSWRRQLEEPTHGQPDMVLTADPESAVPTGGFSRRQDRVVANELKADGFSQVHSFSLTDVAPMAG